MNPFFFVVREAGERTAARCYAEARRQFDRGAMLSVRPFSEAVRLSLALGRECGAEWLVTIDADCELLPDYRGTLEDRVALAKRDCWQILGSMDCFIAGRVRQGGPRAWRIDSLPAEVPTNAERPESALFHAQPGALWVDDWVTCRHGYGQSPLYYYEIGRKPKWRVYREWHRRWQTSADPDLRACWQGLQGLPLHHSDIVR